MIRVVIIAAWAAAPTTVNVVPSARHQASWFHRRFLGDRWREARNAPIEVPVRNTDTFAGGLTAERQGGGLETFNLHLKSGNGRSWVQFASSIKAAIARSDEGATFSIASGFAP